MTLGGGGGVSCKQHRHGLHLVLEAPIVLGVPVVELLNVVVKIAGRHWEGFLGAAAFGPIVHAAVELGPVRASRDGLDAVLEALIVLAVLNVELLLIRVKVTNSVVLLGDGGGFVILESAFLGRLPSARSSGSWIAFKLDGLLPALLGGRLHPVEAEEEGLLAVRLLPGRLTVRLLPWGSACCLRFRHAAVDLGHSSGIPASREGNEVV